MVSGRVRNAPGRLSAVARFWQVSPFACLKKNLADRAQTTNAPDYVGLIVLVVGWIVVALFVKPFHRLFFINDVQIAFPHAEHERVPVCAYRLIPALLSKGL